MPYDPEDDEDDDTAGAFMRGFEGHDDDEAPANGFTAPKSADVNTPAVNRPAGQPLVAATPAKTNVPTATGNAGSPDDDFLKPIPYNPPSRPTGLDQAARQEQADEQAWQQASTPLNRADYKPSIGRRIAGALAGAMVAAGSRNPTAGYNIATNVVDAPYNRAAQTREDALGTATQKLADDRASFSQQDRDYENSLTQYDRSFNAQNLAQDRAERAANLGREQRAQEASRLAAIAPGTQQPDDPDNPMGSWHAVTVGGKKISMSGPPDTWLKTPQGIDAQRDSEVKRLGLTGNDAKFYRANGKLREPPPTTNIRIPSEGFQQYEDWRSSFRRENGRAPNASEIAAYGRKSGNGAGGAPDQVGAIVADATQQKQVFANKYERDNTGNYVPIDENSGPTLSPAEFGAKIDSFRTGANKRLAKMGYQIDNQGDVVETGQTAQPAQTQSGTASNIPNGGGKRLDRTTAATILKAAGGNKDKAREIAKKNNWKF